MVQLANSLKNKAELLKISLEFEGLQGNIDNGFSTILDSLCKGGTKLEDITFSLIGSKVTEEIFSPLRKLYNHFMNSLRLVSISCEKELKE